MVQKVIKAGARRGEPPVRLPPDRFDQETHLTGSCLFCETEDGVRGVVKGGRDNATLAPRFDGVMCHLCGQRYMIDEADRQAFGGPWPA